MTATTNTVKIAQFKTRKGSDLSAYDFRKVQDDYTKGLEWVSENNLQYFDAELPEGWFINLYQLVMANPEFVTPEQARNMTMASSNPACGEFYTMSVNDAVQHGYIKRIN